MKGPTARASTAVGPVAEAADADQVRLQRRLAHMQGVRGVEDVDPRRLVQQEPDEGVQPFAGRRVAALPDPQRTAGAGARSVAGGAGLDDGGTRRAGVQCRDVGADAPRGHTQEIGQRACGRPALLAQQRGEELVLTLARHGPSEFPC